MGSVKGDCCLSRDQAFEQGSPVRPGVLAGNEDAAIIVIGKEICHFDANVSHTAASAEVTCQQTWAARVLTALPALRFRNDLHSQQETIKLLTDRQHKPSWWAHLLSLLGTRK